jgi:glycosyltransferase involved in cell wall biosynthesis
VRHNDKEILKALSQVDILFMTSKSEGTAIPILEAMGLCAIPISTQTRFAVEILSIYFPELLVARNINSFMHAVEKVLENLLK